MLQQSSLKTSTHRSIHPSIAGLLLSQYVHTRYYLPPTQPHTLCNQVVHLLLNSGIICQIVILIVELRESLQGNRRVASPRWWVRVDEFVKCCFKRYSLINLLFSNRMIEENPLGVSPRDRDTHCTTTLQS